MVLTKLKSRIRKAFNYELSLRVGQRVLKVPVINNVGRAHLDRHEPHLGVVLERLYRPDTLLIDVGANIGQTLVKYVAVAGTTCHYLGFEPNAKAASYVEELIIRNGLHKARIVPVGLGSNTRLAQLFLHSAGSTDPAASMHELIRDAEFYGSQKTVPVFRGDDALAELRVVSGPIILKIDVEGAELEVLRGLEKSIERLRPLIILEILPPSYFSASVNDHRRRQADDLIRHMADRGYAVHSIGTDGELAPGVSPTGDYLFVPNEKSDGVSEAQELTFRQ
jgi:FkbM family methyltransferase